MTQTREEKNAYSKTYYRANRERLAAAQMARYNADPERYNEARRAARAADPETTRARERATHLAWVAANPERLRGIRRRAYAQYRLRQHGLTSESYEAMLTQQGNSCGICGGSFDSQRVCIDHDHATGEVRGLLCHSCNVALGHFRDSPDNLRAALRYLEALAAA